MTLSAGPIPRAPVRSFIVIAILKDPLQRPALLSISSQHQLRSRKRMLKGTVYLFQNS